MRYLKKVSVSTLDTSGRIVDSLSTPDNPHINAPSINAVKKANADLTAKLKAFEDDSYYKNGDSITFEGDGWYDGAILNGVWNIDTAYLVLTPRKKIKENQTVEVELTGFNMLTYKDGTFTQLSPAGVPSIYNLFADTLPEQNQIIIKIIFSQADFNRGGLISLSGANMRLTIHED